MSQDGVHNNEMDLPEEPEAQLPSELLGDMRLAYGARLPRAGAALRSLFENGLPRAETEIHRSFRGSLVRLAAVSLALFGTMSGLAVAGALPAPVQNAMSGVAQTVGFDIPDSQPAAEAQTAAGTDPSDPNGTGGADGAGGGASPSEKTTPTTPSATDDGDSSAVAIGPLTPTSGASTPASTTPATTDRSRGATPSTLSRNDDSDAKKNEDEKKPVDTTPTTESPVETTTPTTVDEPTTTTSTTEPEATTTTTEAVPDGGGSGSEDGGGQ